MSELAISTHELAKCYGDVRAVDAINLSVPRGAIYGFLGRNGAGKTTTIKMLLGLARPTGGAADILGLDIRAARIAILQRTAFVSEKKTLYPKMTPLELVRFSRGFYPTWSDTAVQKYSALLDIPMKQRFEKLSNGNQSKVWLLLALCQGADLLILDEPTSAMDPVIVDEVLRVLAEAVLDRQCTIFFSTHQLEEVEQIAEYTGVIDRGKLLIEERLDDIKNDFRVVTATGSSLPRKVTKQLLSVESDGDSCKYVVTQDAEQFIADLKGGGATIVSASPLSLREIFLKLVRREPSCTFGNVGATPLSIS